MPRTVTSLRRLFISTSSFGDCPCPCAVTSPSCALTPSTADWGERVAPNGGQRGALVWLVSVRCHTYRRVHTLDLRLASTRKGGRDYCGRNQPAISTGRNWPHGARFALGPTLSIPTGRRNTHPLAMVRCSAKERSTWDNARTILGEARYQSTCVRAALGGDHERRRYWIGEDCA